MPTSLHQRSRSDPPPIMVEDTDTDTATNAGPSFSPLNAQSRSYSSDERPKQTQDSPTDTGPRRREATWGHRRKHSPHLPWHLPEYSFEEGRVLLIDYVAREYTGQGRRKIITQEFRNVEELRTFYRNESLSKQAALRVIHVQNATWALRFLFGKFNIKSSDNLVGTNFGRWAKYDKPQRRGGKPVLNGKTFRVQRDPWRGISRTAFGCDYLRHYEKNTMEQRSETKNKTRTGEKLDLEKNLVSEKMMELNCYDAQDQPTYGWDVYVQRMSVYIQLKDGEPGQPVDPEIRNPYNQGQYEKNERMNQEHGETRGNGSKYIPKIETLDNGSTIILIESSQSGSVEDTLIGARQEIEQRWRRLTFYLPREDTESDEQLAMGCMDFVLRDVFKALAFTWEKYINICETHVGILEDKIYDNPADESRAPELWVNSSLWLKVERLIYLHTDISKEMRNHLRDLYGTDPSEDQIWLNQTTEELEKLTNQFQEGVVKPTDNLSDLMYKSVGIRDARHSLQLGLSMWRLSWITFIFLPLTFVCGFFGMNVATFENNPSIKWFFASALPLLVVMMMSWYFTKHAIASQRQDPLRRGVYESLYHSLSTEHPDLWTRKGPKDGVVPIGRWAAFKWQLLVYWFSPEKTLANHGHEPGDEELSVWSRIKRRLVRRWLQDLPTINSGHVELIAMNTAAFASGDLTYVGELMKVATPIAIADTAPAAANQVGKTNLLGRLRSLSRGRGRASADRPASARDSSEGRPASGVMIEEKGASEDERSGGEDEGTEGDSKRKSNFPARLTVPLHSESAGGVAGEL